jgi:hypothetical protein
MTAITPEETRSMVPEEETVLNMTQSKEDKDEKLVTLGEEDPKKLPTMRKWLIVAVISSPACKCFCPFASWVSHEHLSSVSPAHRLSYIFTLIRTYAHLTLLDH